MIKSLLYAVGAIARFYESRAHSIALRDLKFCENKQQQIHEKIFEATRENYPDDHISSLHRWLRQWQERTASFDERLQGREQ